MAELHDESAPTSIPASSNWPHDRPPTLDDLRVKLCWICREEERFGIDEQPNPPRRWVHPCTCTLVAHESCLLKWMSTKSSNASDSVKCPQCATEYTVKSNKTRSLIVLRFLNAAYSTGAKYVIIGAFAYGIHVCSALYGAHALRTFLGNDFANMILSDSIAEWDWSTWANLSLLPWAIISINAPLAARTTGWIPFILLNVPTWFMGAGSGGLTQLSPTFYPPSPTMTVMMIPFLRSVYQRAYRSVRSRVFGFKLRPTGHIFRRRYNIVPHAQIQAQEALRLEEPEQVEEEVVHVSGTTLGRFFIGTLLLPTVSKVMGSVLKFLSGNSPLLRTALGIKPRSYNIMRMGIYRTWEDVDPVWWRNLVGLSLFVVGKDAIKLWYSYLQVREKKSRKLISRSFEGVDLNGLDLIV
ncbi:hypothetical protein BOTBODRAFT_144280 [Botryobasidium botryosum FD-172 SS1]|uniref:RING-CH-type domain-containing protein n=1 Tax=Botryobasidium botryosum (strain FD-172 SS1) TaxID=930990 RepID=A0A067MYG4_BOTB1|nr:hypothetical protein BOTBODRAFT_144280 [Botryobasidium botryosum FD-172 SS1]